MEAPLEYEEQLMRLRQELEDAQSVLQSKQSDLELSATIGKRLLEENIDLGNRMDAAVTAHAAQIEELQQANYNLKAQLSQIQVNGSLNQDLDKENASLKDDVNKLRIALETLQREHDRTVAESADKVKIWMRISQSHADFPYRPRP